MTHISKKEIPAQELNLLVRKTVLVLANLDKKTVQPFFNSFFTDSERIMFTKRLCAVIMLDEGHSSYRIADTLRLSTSTVDRIKLKYETGNYDAVLRVIKKDKVLLDVFLTVIEKILSAGMPPRGKGRWKYILTTK